MGLAVILHVIAHLRLAPPRDGGTAATICGTQRIASCLRQSHSSATTPQGDTSTHASSLSEEAPGYAFMIGLEAAYAPQ